MAGKTRMTNGASGKFQTTGTIQTTLSAKRKQWLECVHGDDENSIRRQITDLLCDLREWWTINSALRFTSRDENGEPKVWRLLHELLNRCFVTKQMVTVRRLCDRNPFEGKNEVWSLVSLLDDMKNHVRLLTRNAIFEGEGIRYDLLAIERDVERERLAATSGNEDGNAYSRWTSAVIEQRRSKRRHEELDLLAGVKSAARSGDDSVRPELFDAMKLCLTNTCDDTCKKVNKFLAHAATPKDRPEGVSSSETPAALFDAARVVKETFDFASCIVLGTGCPLLPEGELFDVLEYIECSQVRVEDVPEVRRVWVETGQKLSASFADAGEFIEGLGVFA